MARQVEGGWSIGGFEYDENPRYTTPGWARRLVRIWAETRRLARGPMGPSAVLLPLAGGYCDQPAAAMDAFELFDAWAAERRGHEPAPDA